MRRIHDSRILVAGAGALGNEVIKDLALAGFGNIVVADPDIIEESNLSRCVLFRDGDIGRNKAEVAASRAKDLYPGCATCAEPRRIQQIDLSGFDVFIGCLDSISARLHLNSFAMYHHVPYVDGATDGFRGKMQVILSDGPCMECGINRTHINELHRTFSCDPSKSQREVDPVTLSSGITTTSIIA
ncbi:MAG: ThiF family adenylyltransferase, partial [archaeon]|nr:ThiF family adenylyltransferase [archaeon]